MKPHNKRVIITVTALGLGAYCFAGIYGLGVIAILFAIAQAL